MPKPNPQAVDYSAIAEPSSSSPYQVDYAQIQEPDTPVSTLTTEESERARLLKPHVKFMTPAETGHAALGLLPTVGGVAGGIVGGIAGAPSGPGAVAAGALGAGLGGEFGEGLRLLGEKYLFHDPTKMTSQQVMRRMAVQGAVQAGSDATGRAAGMLISPAIKSLGLTANASEQAGVRLLPSEAAGSAPSYMEKLVKGSLYTSKQMDRFRVMQNAQTKSAVQRVADSIDNFAGAPEELGQMVQKGIDQHTQAFRATQKQMYKAIDQAVGEKTVQVPVTSQVPSGILDKNGHPLMINRIRMMDQTTDNLMPSRANIVEFAEQELKKIQAGKSAAGKAPESAYETILNGIVNNPSKTATYEGMSQARSQWLAQARDMNSGLSGPQAGFVKKMAGLADESMITAADKSGIPGLTQQIREANAFTANEHQMFNQALVKKVVGSKKPEQIATLLRTKSVGLQETRDLFSILPQELHAPVQRQLLVDTMRQSVDPVSQSFNEGKFANAILNMGDERGTVIFGQKWKNIRELSQLMGKINGPLGMGGGSGAALQNSGIIKLATGGAVAVPLTLLSAGHVGGAGIASATELAGAAGYAAGLKAFATAITNPESAIKLLKSVRMVAKATPYAATGAVSVAAGTKKGQQAIGKGTQALQDIRDKYAPTTPTVPADPIM